MMTAATGMTDEDLRLMAVGLANGDVGVASRIVDFVRPVAKSQQGGDARSMFPPVPGEEQHDGESYRGEKQQSDVPRVEALSHKEMVGRWTPPTANDGELLTAWLARVVSSLGTYVNARPY